MSQLNDNLTEILRQKNAYLLPKNIKKDVTVLGITGTYEGSGGNTKPYIELEYIESTGTQYIDTGIIANNTTKVEIQANITSGTYLFGEGINGQYVNISVIKAGNVYKSRMRNGASSNILIASDIATGNTIHTFNVSQSDGFIIDDVFIGKDSEYEYEANHTFPLFAWYNGSSYSDYSSARLGYCKIYNNGVLIRDFIPVKRKIDDEICLYDKVTETFFINQGTGVFTAGPEKVEITMNIFVQTTEPEVKKGLWLQTDETMEYVEMDDKVFTGGTWEADGIRQETPHNMNYSACTSIDEYIYSFRHIYAYKYDTLTDTYTQLTDVPYKIYSAGIACIGTDIYLLGGSSSKTNNYKYDTLTDTYTKLTDIPYEFNNSPAVVIGTDIYLLGGYDNSYFLYKYDTLTDTYTRLRDLPYQFVNGLCTVIGSTIYLFGGSNTSYAYKYDILTDTYTRLADMPYSMSGGVAGYNTTDIYLFDDTKTYKYNVLADTYTRLADIPYEFNYGSGTFVHNSFFLIGGENTAINKVQVYNLQNKTYTQNNLVVINQGKYSEIGYDVELLSNTKFITPALYSVADAFFYTTEDGLITDIPTYYGNGTQWINIKNPPTTN